MFTSESLNTISVVSYRRVKPFGLIMIIVSGSRYKLLDPILTTNIGPHMFNIIGLKTRGEVRAA